MPSKRIDGENVQVAKGAFYQGIWVLQQKSLASLKTPILLNTFLLRLG